MREMLSTTGAIYGQGLGETVALITDGRFLEEQEVLYWSRGQKLLWVV